MAREGAKQSPWVSGAPLHSRDTRGGSLRVSVPTPQMRHASPPVIPRFQGESQLVEVTPRACNLADDLRVLIDQEAP
jgi:DNA-binding transcriptional LysR family regulator